MSKAFQAFSITRCSCYAYLTSCVILTTVNVDVLGCQSFFVLHELSRDEVILIVAYYMLPRQIVIVLQYFLIFFFILLVQNNSIRSDRLIRKFCQYSNWFYCCLVRPLLIYSYCPSFVDPQPLHNWQRLRREAVVKIFLPPFGCDLVRPPYVVIDSNLFSMILSFYFREIL